MDDVRAVMDAVGSERAAIMGESEGGPLAMLFAAAHPERTRALILQGAEVRERTDAEWPWGEATPEEFAASTAGIPERWGKVSQKGVPNRIPSLANHPSLPAIEEWWAKVQRNAATPAAWEAFARMAYDIDVRDMVASIHVPTLILHATGDRVCNVENARWLSTHLSDATFIELPGGDHPAVVRSRCRARRDPRVPDRLP